MGERSPRALHRHLGGCAIARGRLRRRRPAAAHSPTTACAPRPRRAARGERVAGRGRATARRALAAPARGPDGDESRGCAHVHLPTRRRRAGGMRSWAAYEAVAPTALRTASSRTANCDRPPRRGRRSACWATCLPRRIGAGRLRRRLAPRRPAGSRARPGALRRAAPWAQLPALAARARPSRRGRPRARRPRRRSRRLRVWPSASRTCSRSTRRRRASRARAARAAAAPDSCTWDGGPPSWSSRAPSSSTSTACGRAHRGLPRAGVAGAAWIARFRAARSTGDGRHPRGPRLAGRCLRVLAELGLVESRAQALPLGARSSTGSESIWSARRRSGPAPLRGEEGLRFLNSLTPRARER